MRDRLTAEMPIAFVIVLRQGLFDAMVFDRMCFVLALVGRNMASRVKFELLTIFGTMVKDMRQLVD